MSGTPKENEIGRLLSRTWSRRRRRADSPSLQNAMHLDRNQEFDERRGDGIKYIFAVLVLFVLLIYALSQMIGLEWA